MRNPFAATPAAHIGATEDWGRVLTVLQGMPTAPDLQPVPAEVQLLHQAQRELDGINHAIARFSRRVGQALDVFLGEVEATNELDLAAVARLLAEGRELATP